MSNGAELPDRIVAGDVIEIVAHCRGPYCAMADGAVRLLRRRGRSARRLEGSYPEWQPAQLPINSERQPDGERDPPRPRR